MPAPDSDFSETDLERVRRAADRLDEALDELGLTAGAPAAKRALELLQGVEGVETIESESDAVERLREADPATQLTGGRRALERRAEA